MNQALIGTTHTGCNNSHPDLTFQVLEESILYLMHVKSQALQVSGWQFETYTVLTSLQNKLLYLSEFTESEHSPLHDDNNTRCIKTTSLYCNLHKILLGFILESRNTGASELL
jgi:hypothetical protein